MFDKFRSFNHCTLFYNFVFWIYGIFSLVLDKLNNNFKHVNLIDWILERYNKFFNLVLKNQKKKKNINNNYVYKFNTYLLRQYLK